MRRGARKLVAAALGVVFGIAGSGCAQKTRVRERPAPLTEETPAARAPQEEEPVSTIREVPDAPAADPIRLRGVKLVQHEGQSGIFIKLSRPPEKVEHFSLTKPSRLVIDVFGPVDTDGADFERTPTGLAAISKVRVARQSGRMRFVLDLKEPKPKYEVNELKEMLVAFIGERSGQPAPPTEEVLYAADGEPSTPKASASMAAASTPAAEGRTAPRNGVHQYSGQKISLDFKDADILNVLRILAEVSGLNIVATDDVKGRVTLRLVDVPWDQALDIVLEANRLDKVAIGNVVRVSTVTRLKEEREAQLAAEEAAKDLEPLETGYVSVNYMKVGDPEDKLTDKIKDVLSERGKVTVDRRTNTVIVRDIARGVEAARELIARLDTQTPQVLIESNVVEMTTNFQRDLGIQWGFNYGFGPQFGNATGREFPNNGVIGGSTGGGSNGPGVGAGAVPGTGPPGAISPGSNSGPTIGPGGVPSVPIPFIADFPAQTVAAGEGAAFDLALGSINGSKALNAKLTAIERDGKGRVLSRPRIVTLNNLPAVIESIRIFRVRLPSTGTVISTAPGGVAGSATSATEQIRTGITLNVTPQVSSDGFILMDIHVKSSAADFGQQVDNIPAEISREAHLNVLIRDGETLVIGGVLRDDSQNQENGLPYLRSIPVLGWLAKRLFRTNQREELIVFITPKIVRGMATAASLPSARDLWDGRQTY